MLNSSKSVHTRSISPDTRPLQQAGPSFPTSPKTLCELPHQLPEIYAHTAKFNKAAPLLTVHSEHHPHFTKPWQQFTTRITKRQSVTLRSSLPGRGCQAGQARLAPRRQLRQHLAHGLPRAQRL